MSEKKERKIKITEARGRPMLNWVGKKPLDYVKGFPAQLVEIYDPSGKATPIETLTFDKVKDNWQNLLFHGDNKEVLAFLLENGFRGKVDMVYIDPPFDSAANYIRQVELRETNERKELEGEDYTLTEQIQYYDIWANDSYLQFMYERLLIIKELLSEKGLIILHADWHKNHHLRLLLDEIFGDYNFLNEIIWYHWTKFQMRDMGSLTRNHDTLLVYTKARGKHIFNPITRPLDRPKKLKRIFWDKNKGKIQNIKDKNGKVVYDEVYDEKVDDVWDIPHVGTKANERKGYPTQKPEELLDYIIKCFSNPESIILDCFIGSGTTAVVAQKTNRRWIGVDINKGAIQTTSKRLQGVIAEQYEKYVNEKKQQKLKKEDDLPEYFTFSNYKVNDYDLQLLRTEAIELAIQHIGILRTKTDAFFEGTLGRNLVKMIDFNHPLILLDLQLIQDELKKRPDENRNVTIVCLGKELVVNPWIEDYNKKHSVNKLEVIELRTDQKYGKFLIHKPTSAQVDFKRKGKKAIIELKNFISPTIIERLNKPESLVKVKIPDFRSMIDVVLIDIEYDGKIFNTKHSDVPEKKSDLVEGKYEIEIPVRKSTIAVKIIDMLGEEVIVTKEI